MFSLLHFLASHPRNADTLKKALQQNTDARRLLGCFGITPTHLADLDEGAIARRSAAVSVPRTVEVMASASCADRLAEAEEAIRVLRDRAESAESASEHGPLTDLLVITGRKVETFYLPKAPEECRYGVSVEGYLHTHGATPREALIRMRDQVRERLAQTAAPAQTPPEEVIVLGPWRRVGVQWFRRCVGASDAEVCAEVTPDGWGAGSTAIGRLGFGGETGEKGKSAADDWARKTYALIDAEPGSLKGMIGPFAPYGVGCSARSGWVSVRVGYSWDVWDGARGVALAHGPQTGEEGKRYALAAAHALGLTGGDE